MKHDVKHIKTITVVALVTWSILLGISHYFFSQFQTINYYNLILEFIISNVALYLLYSIQAFKHMSFYKTLGLGYYLLFVSYFVDAIDQIYIHSVFYTVFLEKLTLLVSFIMVYLGTKAWMLNYQKLALTDDLTQLPNRNSIKRYLQNLISQCKKTPKIFSLIIIDIDHFKNINDLHGHYFGDSILNQFAQLVQSSLKDNETLGRWGGEEFVLIKENINKVTACKQLEDLKQIIEKHSFKTDKNTAKLTASFGVSEYNCLDQNFKSLFIDADKALYNAKNSGRNRIR